MTAARSYKKPMAVWAARRELADCAGGQFDPEIVRAFLSISLPKLLWRTGPVTLAVQLPFLGRLQEVGLQSVTAMTQGVAAATVAAGVTAMVVAGPIGASAHGHHTRASDEAADTTNVVPAPSPTGTEPGPGGSSPAPERSHTGATGAESGPRGSVGEPVPDAGPDHDAPARRNPDARSRHRPRRHARAHADPRHRHPSPLAASPTEIPLPLPTEIPLPIPGVAAAPRYPSLPSTSAPVAAAAPAPSLPPLPIPRPLALLPSVARHRGLTAPASLRSIVRRRSSAPCSRVLRAMLFPTVDFAIFFCLVFLGHWLLNARPVPWKLFMIGASYVFYAWWDWHFVWLLAGVSFVAQLGGLAVAKQEEPVRRRLVMAIAVAATLAPLAFFKYYGFFAVNATNGLSRLGIHAGPPLIQVVLPVGISFFSFMAVVLHRGHPTPATRSPRAGSTSSCTSRSSRTWSPDRSCGRTS